MPAPPPNGSPRRESRQELEEQLFAELKQAEAAFKNAPPDQKEMAGEQYRSALERFNAVILGNTTPSGSDGRQ